MAQLKDAGLVIAPYEMVFPNNVKGVPLAEYRERVLRKKLIKLSEISKAQLWGEVGQKRVYQLAQKLVPEKDRIQKKPKGEIYIPRAVVRSIAIARGAAYDN